jgi:hypothetical protein
MACDVLSMITRVAMRAPVGDRAAQDGGPMATGTASLLLGAPHRRLGGVTPYLSLWFYEDATGAYWCTEQVPQGRVSWAPRSPERSLADGLVLLLALTSLPRDPIPLALSQMAGGLPWNVGHVDVSTWRHYDSDLLDGLVAGIDPPGKLVVSLLPETSVSDLSALDALDWDVDVLAPARSHRSSNPDLHATSAAGGRAQNRSAASAAASAARAGMAGAAGSTHPHDGTTGSTTATGTGLPTPRDPDEHPDAARGA